MGEEKFLELLQELEKVRNLLLIYRMLHHEDKFPDIPLNITGREKQLFKPILRIFNDTDTQKELENVISNYINERRASNVDSQHAFVFRTVVELINEKGSHELSSKDIWDRITTVPGEFLYKGYTKFETVDYGLMTQKLVTKICKEVLGAKPSRDKTKRKLVFDKIKLNRLNELFNLTLELKVTHMTDVTHSGMAKYVLRSEGNKENENIDTKNNDYSNISNEKKQNISTTTNAKTQEHSRNASQASQASPQTTCPKCGELLDPDPHFASLHNCEGTD